ncbi:PiggyBac transposable element-derived protein 4-like [Plakobranchus ocellatus]|uniref:PiggyBac transposable element-derived protein 4-like n=1 Tax=Plakobranchus ocellatus TaxID=259542 RepID=A0AAV3YS54_9GAST|nr:PiggyBac transposable element-derived protein 4-like [Plakobranchus ocellatus]
MDEAMEGFKGRLSFKQYMPAKPTQWGIKVWTVSDTCMGFCLSNIYTNAHPHQLSDYNRFMGGVDVLDQQQLYYPIGRPDQKYQEDRRINEVRLKELTELLDLNVSKAQLIDRLAKVHNVTLFLTDVRNHRQKHAKKNNFGPSEEDQLWNHLQS